MRHTRETQQNTLEFHAKPSFLSLMETFGADGAQMITEAARMGRKKVEGFDPQWWLLLCKK